MLLETPDPLASANWLARLLGVRSTAVNGAPEVAAFGCVVRFVSGAADRVTRIVLDGTEGPVGNVVRRALRARGMIHAPGSHHGGAHRELDATCSATHRSYRPQRRLEEFEGDADRITKVDRITARPSASRRWFV
jgi:hypothetical protein